MLAHLLYRTLRDGVFQCWCWCGPLVVAGRVLGDGGQRRHHLLVSGLGRRTREHRPLSHPESVVFGQVRRRRVPSVAPLTCMHGTARRRCLDDSKQNPTPVVLIKRDWQIGVLLSHKSFNYKCELAVQCAKAVRVPLLARASCGSASVELYSCKNRGTIRRCGSASPQISPQREQACRSRHSAGKPTDLAAVRTSSQVTRQRRVEA